MLCHLKQLNQFFSSVFNLHPTEKINCNYYAIVQYTCRFFSIFFPLYHWVTAQYNFFCCIILAHRFLIELTNKRKKNWLWKKDSLNELFEVTTTKKKYFSAARYFEIHIAHLKPLPSPSAILPFLHRYDVMWFLWCNLSELMQLMWDFKLDNEMLTDLIFGLALVTQDKKKK